ncbi:MAG: T9SS type A sorting domain-containing protein, partial [Candidatus Cloacimonetes bacterium]|nr:T9SS type A sorting domain-containing protein [Candidatus Cloacimonadota bacterium]
YTYYVPNTGFDTPHPGVLNYLGDVNGDGCDDLGFTESPWITTTTPGHFFDNDYYVMYGDPIEPYVEKLGTYQAETRYFETFINGLGDVNNDGYDDIFISYTDRTSVLYNMIRSNGIVYGGAVIDTTLNFITIPEDFIDSVHAPKGHTIGDFNGDGIDDFIGYMSRPGIWFGNNNLDLNIADIQVNSHMTFNMAVVYGDFNGDGYADFVLSDDNTFMPQEGQAFLFLGGPYPNVVPDLHIRGDDYIWGIYMSAYFGKSMTVADFNNDGYDDLAISAPYDSATIQGKVFILLGNPNLSDTTVPTTDEVVEINPVIFNVYPNPAKDILNFEYKNIENYHNLSIDIYNIKGQKVKEIVLNSKDIKNGTVNTTLTNLPSAIYLCRLKSNNQTLNTKKVSVIK